MDVNAKRRIPRRGGGKKEERERATRPSEREVDWPRPRTFGVGGGRRKAGPRKGGKALPGKREEKNKPLVPSRIKKGKFHPLSEKKGGCG